MLSMLADGGDAGALIRSIDWSKTPLGPPATWPKTLLSTVGMILRSRHPMFLWWGPELIQFYNDAYLPSFGQGKHPAAMGQRGRECWGEIWSIVSPQIDDVMHRSKASWHEDALVPIERNGRVEDVYWTYGYSPVFGDDGKVGGTLVVCSETTARVLAARRSESLRALLHELSTRVELEDVENCPRVICEAARADIPFALSYQRDTPSGQWQATAFSDATDATRSDVDAIVASYVDTTDRPTPMEYQATRARVFPLHAKPSIVGHAEPIQEFVVLTPPTMKDRLFVFGIAPRIPFDTAYDAFLNHVVEQVDIIATRLEAFHLRASVESERRNLLLQAPVATALTVGPRHRYELANQHYRDMVGGRDVIGKEYVEAFPEVLGTPIVDILDHVYQRGEPFAANEYMVMLRDKHSGDLKETYFRFNLEPLRDSRGLVYGMMVVAVDISEQVSSRHALEKTTNERGKLLEQLEAAGRAKDEFLATVSHELRTPLNAILGWSHVLHEGADEARIRKGLAVIQRNAQAQAKLIEDILDVSRIISGKTRMNMRRVDTVAVIHAAAESVRPQAATKSIRVSVEVASELVALVADEDRLQQVIWNLLSNAVKFTPEGGEILVNARHDDTHVVFSVRDNGKGIAPTLLPHVFDRFWQDDASSTKEHAGLGLGLAIVHHLVQLHGGSVTAASEGLGKGATFEVRIPVRAVQPQYDSVPAPPLAEPTASPVVDPRVLMRDRLVLVVDDQEDGRDLIATVLEDAGARVLQADSVPRALALLETENPDCIVSDIGMPGENGYTFIESIRARGRSPLRNIPALALTAYARPEDRRRALRAGFQEHAAKPIDPQNLVEIVARLSQPRNSRVLVVDDNEDAAELLSMTLELAGYSVSIAHDGADALEAADKSIPFAIILDISMPGMSGYDVADRLRKDPRFADTALVAVTGWGSDDDKLKAMKSGFDFHLTKPVDANDLRNILMRASDRQTHLV